MDILSFYGDRHWLSNFHMASITYEGLTYTNSEAAFQAAKCKEIEDRNQFTNLLPGNAKTLGRNIELRPDWDQVKDQIMYDVCKAKFEQNPDLMNLLLATTGHLEEGNNHGDIIWGTVKGVGQNRLGKILMQLRDEFRNAATAKI